MSLPPRRYDLAGAVMAEAIDRSSRTGVPVLDALRSAAGDIGARLGGATAPGDTTAPSDATVPGEATAPGNASASSDDAMATTCRVLTEHGYEPHEVDGRIELANCPFHSLVADHADLVCSMNLTLVGAVAAAADHSEEGAACPCVRLDPADGRCCVVIEPRQIEPRQQTAEAGSAHRLRTSG